MSVYFVYYCGYLAQCLPYRGAQKVIGEQMLILQGLCDFWDITSGRIWTRDHK